MDRNVSAGLPARGGNFNAWLVAIGAACAACCPGQAAIAGACRVVNYGTLPVELVNERATTEVKLNGHDTHILLDSGAFFNFMSEATAQELGLKLLSAPSELVSANPGWRLGGTATVSGVGGSAEIRSVMVNNVGLLGATIRNVKFLVGGSDTGMAVVGANLLDAADLEIDLAQGKLSLMKPDGCGSAPLAYWVKDDAYQIAELRPQDGGSESYVDVVINGHSVLALIDTGAPVTLLARRAAERAGIDLTSSKVKSGEFMSGIGAKSYKTWIVPIDKFSVGTETVQHSQMLVLDGEIEPGYDAPEMLLGLDFIIAHHMYIANGQGKIYFTYNGGRIFALAKSAPGRAAAGSHDTASIPATAADFALRGEAHLTRGEISGGIADLDAAISLAPKNPSYYLARGTAKLQSGQSDGALSDLNTALGLDPANVEALLLRAQLLIERKDADAAGADVAAARKLAPEGSTVALSIAHFDLTADHPEDALPIYDAWIRLHAADSAMGEVLNARCWARGLANQMLAGALADCGKAIRLDGAKPAYLDSLGLVLLRQGKFAEAISAYSRALTGNPQMAWSLYGRGLAAQHDGLIESGAADLARARQIMPEIDRKASKFGLGAR